MNSTSDKEQKKLHSVVPKGFTKEIPLHLTPTEAESFYRKECENNNIYPNNSFTKQLLAGVTIFNFDNGYLGEKGIIPILSTLQKVAIVELSMKSCEVTSEDISLIQKTFATHDTLRKIDLRGVTLTVAGARKLLTLAVQNSNIEEILIDEDTPKYLYIQKQCFSNANVTLFASKCLICSKSVIHSPDQRIETRLLQGLGDEFQKMEQVTSSVALQVLFRCILACCEVNDGVLFICSSECRIQLSNDIIIAIRAVISEYFNATKINYPKNFFLKRCVIDTLKLLSNKLSKPQEKNEVDVIQNKNKNKSRYSISSRLKKNNAYYHDTEKNNNDNYNDDDNSTSDESDDVLEKCTICGTEAVCLSNAAFLIMEQICTDVDGGYPIHPSAFLRLVKLMISYSEMRPCSKNCIIHLIRFGIFGYGGVLEARALTGDPSVSSLGISLSYLPSEDFSILNFSLEYIDEIEEEDTCCALTVASAMSDIDGVVIDPYMIFAVGRHLAKLSNETLGMELRHACNAVQVVGCLPTNIGPFNRRSKREKPPRNLYVSWNEWSKYTNLDYIVRVAFSRRRQGVYIVDGPHGNLFDNTRATLWAFQAQRRSILVAIKFCMEWLTFPGGIIPNEAPIKRGFLTTFKIVGQTNIDNTFYIICQGNFGAHVGNHGFFYIPRAIFNLYVSGSAYIFLDVGACTSCRGKKEELYASRIFSRSIIELTENTSLLRELIYHSEEGLIWSKRPRIGSIKIMLEAFRHIPPSIFFIYRNCDRDTSDSQNELFKTIRRLCFSDSARSLLLFYFTEVLGPAAVEWFLNIINQLKQIPPIRILLRNSAETISPIDLERSQSKLQWKSLTITTTAIASTTTPLGELKSIKKNLIGQPKLPPRILGRKTPPLRSDKRVTIEKKKFKGTHDVFKAKLEHRWSSIFSETDILRGQARLSKHNSISIIRPSLKTNESFCFTARSMALGIEEIPSSLIGQPWRSVRLCSENGKITEYALFFIKDYTCCFNLENQTVVFPLHPILESTYSFSFPFPTGFDCVLNSPINPRIAYFFCGEEWIEWDTYMQSCIGGPFKLSLHKEFESLPSEFLRGIDSAVPIPNTSCALLFSQLKYIIFDFKQHLPVSDIKRIGDIETYEGVTPTFCPELAKIFPYGPMATLLMNIEEENDNDNNNNNNNKSNKKTNESENLLNNKNIGVMLIGKDGRVAIVKSFFTNLYFKKNKEEEEENNKKEWILKTLPTTPLVRLPLALRQMTFAALHGVCEEALNKECKRSCIVVESTNLDERQINAINSTFTLQKENADILLSLTRRDMGFNITPLIRDEVVFIQTEESILNDPPQVIEVDYGITNPVAFGLLVAVLDLTCIDFRVLRIAPIQAVIESSDDGVTYFRHSQFIIKSYVTAISWGEAHVSRFWRLKFISRLPSGTGIARLLWYEVTRALGTVALDPSILLVPRDSTKVNIRASRIFCPAKELLNSLAPGSAFMSSSNNGWFNKHCILPLLPNGKFCLLFCATNFVELDCERGLIASQRAVSINDHPAFFNLPYPFLNGFNAIFYPNLRNPNTVALVHGKKIILWNLKSGISESDIKDASNMYFKGMPWNMDQIEDIVQIWDSPGDFFIIRTPQVLRWNINSEEIIEGPMLIKDCPYLYHLKFKDKSLLCVTSFPNNPKRFYVFCENLVAAQTVLDNKITDIIEPKPVRHFNLFSPITWYLNWGKKRYDSIIQLDFKEEQPLLIGLIMRSSEPCDEEWILEYSDDGIEWKIVGNHRQNSGHCRTMWGLASVENRSHRLWRLTTNSLTMRYGAKEDSVLYTNLSFFTLPSVPYRLTPQKVALSGTLNGPISALFLEENATVAFENNIDLKETSIPPTHHVTLDYGEYDPPDLMAFACHCRGENINNNNNNNNVIWSIWCSDDGENWENCGVWRSKFNHFKTSWTPRGPRQYWRIELQSWESNILYENLRLFEYVGPSICIENSTPLGEGWDPSILWNKTLKNCKISPMIFSAQIGSTIVFDSKRDAVHIVGVRVVSFGKQSTSTKFAIECSLNAIDWKMIDANLLLRGSSAEVVWEECGYYRYWRLRIIYHTGPSFLMFSDICFETLKPTLYHFVESVKDNKLLLSSSLTSSSSLLSNLELNLGGELMEIVAVKATLPPNTNFVVEKLSLDGSSWEEIAMLENFSLVDSKTIRQGWIPQGKSSNWRLRPIIEDNNRIIEETTITFSSSSLSPQTQSAPLSQQQIITSQTSKKQKLEQQNFYNDLKNNNKFFENNMHIQWYAFTGKTLIRSIFTNNNLVEVKTTGFIEVQSPKHLTENYTDTVVLRSINQEKVATIVWYFKNDTMPRFNQVYLKGRIVENTEVSLPESSIPLQLTKENNLNSNGSNKKKTTRQRGNSNGNGNGNGNGEIKEVKPEEIEKEIILSIIIETSGNGIDFVPIAERPFSKDGNTLSWHISVASSYWRIRIIGILPKDYLEIRQVSWFVEKGITAMLAPQTSCALSNPMYDTWKNATFNREDEFCKMCRQGYDQAKSIESGLREEGDIERNGILAQRVAQLRSEFLHFNSKISKEAVKDQNPPEDKFISIGKPLSNDIMYKLYRYAKRYECNVDELNTLISHPMLFGRDFVKSKDDLSWFYPKYEEKGTLVESFYGFHNVRASFCILWSLSLQLQWKSELLDHSSITPLSPHLASVIIIVNIGESNWLAAEHFPNLPLLYHAGFTEKPVVIVFALNQITFNSKYNLSIPGTTPFPAIYPFSIFSGVNFIQRMTLSSCPCPIFDRLQIFYSKEFLLLYETEVVFTSPTMNSNNATVRFTLPGKGIDFSISGLFIESIEFEVQLKIEIEDDENFNLGFNKGLINFPHRITFVTHNTIFKYSDKDLPINLSLAGCINDNEDVVKIYGSSPSAKFPLKCKFPDAFITNINISFDLISGEDMQTFIEPFFTLEGTLTTPKNGSYICRFRRARLNRSYESMSLQVQNLQLADLIKLGNYLVGISSEIQNIEWMNAVPIFFSLEFQMNYPEIEFIGTGIIEFAGFRGDAIVTVSVNGVGITATFLSLTIGSIYMKGRSNNNINNHKDDEDDVLLSISAPINSSSIIRLDGYSYLLAPNLCPIRIELSKSGILGTSTGIFYDLCIDEDSFFPSAINAQVSISEKIITNCLNELLNENPLIISLLAKGIPFSFEVEEVLVEECLLERQIIFLTIRGVLFGCRFDVMTSVIRPDNSLEGARNICQDIIPRIVEQCDEPLWGSYDMFVGYLLRGKSHELREDENKKNNKNEEIANNTDIMDPVLTNHLVKVKKGKFIGHWMARECEMLDNEMNNDFDPIVNDKNSVNWSEI